MLDLDAILPVTRFEETVSTNALAREAARAGEIPTPGRMWIARRQTAGVGQRGRAWQSPEGGLWCTLAWRLSAAEAPGVVAGLGVRVGVGCLRTIEGVLGSAGEGADLRLKWPNDVLIGGRKVCGSLCEVVPAGGETVLIVGVGMNVNNAMEATGLATPATSLGEFLGRSLEVDALALGLRGHLHGAMTVSGLSGGWLSDARRWLHGVGGEASVRDGAGRMRQARLVGLADNGWLEFETVSPPRERLRVRSAPEANL
ncbi:MAG: biotin--[acetyl-CoA-carboxylase] ligase [Phycisphaerales bacterium]|nr:biotin--[acetyl-CoA-carboxylase] ligase [Phycisphaerales bacterium]